MVDYRDSSKITFFEILVRRRQKQLFLKAFVISLIFYCSLFSVFFVTFDIFKKKVALIREEVIIVGNAEYIPFPEQKKEEPGVENKKAENSITGKKDEKNLSPLLSNKKNSSDSWEYRTKEKPDLSWRQSISNITEPAEKQIKQLDSIEVNPKTVKKSEIVSSPQINTGEGDEREIILYSKKMQAIIRSHWSVPEDLALKYGNKPVEVEIELDISGNLLNYVIRNTSGNSVYDASIKEAIKKSFPFLPPPKNLLKTPFQSAKITIVFKL